MRYRLRTLLIAAGLGPPVVALLWFSAIWARYALPDGLHAFASAALLPCALTAVLLVIYSAVAPPPRSKAAASVSLVQLGLLWTAQFLALWYWLWFDCWMGILLFYRGGPGPPVSGMSLALIAAALAGGSASIVSLRSRFGLATVNYVFIIWCVTLPLLAITALFWMAALLAYLLR